MLYPRMNEARLLADLGGVWSFRTAQAEGYPEAWAQKPLEEAMTMAVPASYNDQKDDVNLRGHYGWAVYQRTFTPPRRALTKAMAYSLVRRISSTALPLAFSSCWAWKVA